MKKIRRRGEVTREKLTSVRQCCPHGFREAAEVDGIEEDIGILWQQGVHFSKQCWGAAITKRCHIQDPKAPLEGRGGKSGEQRLLKEKVAIRGGSNHPMGEVTNSSEDFGRKSTDDVNITNVAVGRKSSEHEFGFSMLKPASRVV
jgi:hypothetical protein